MQTIINIYLNISLIRKNIFIKIRKNTPKKIQTRGVRTTSNVETGVSSLTGIIAIASTSLAALIISKKNK